MIHTKYTHTNVKSRETKRRRKAVGGGREREREREGGKRRRRKSIFPIYAFSIIMDTKSVSCCVLCVRRKTHNEREMMMMDTEKKGYNRNEPQHSF